uniref:THAP-type domain-containing protein n=1 Tax=Strigamia maritima TaxID=126957 RepID=T1JB72_STRMM
MPCCSAVGCSNRSERGFRLFKFPANINRRQVWITNCRRDNWVPTKSSFLCEAHFEPDQYEQNRADGRKLLKPFALPTIFKHDFKPETLTEQVDYRPNAISNVVIPISAAIDHTYTIKRNTTPPMEKRIFTQVFQEDEDPPTRIVELSFESLGVSRGELSAEMELSNVSNGDSDNEAIENILKFWDNQTHLEVQPREDSFREILGEPHLQNVETVITMSDCLTPTKLKKHKTTSSKLEAKIKNLEMQLRVLKKNRRKEKTVAKQKTAIDLNKLHDIAGSGNLTAKFILDQAMILCNNSSKYSEFSLKNCLDWRMRSPNGYDHVQKQGFLKLPSRHLLKRRIGFSTGHKILTTNMKNYLNKSNLKNINNGWCLIVEEMCIKQCSAKSMEFFYGQVINEEMKLFCVYVKGVSIDISTLIGFFPITHLDNIGTSKLIVNLIKEIETIFHGVKIVQLIIPHTLVDIFTHWGCKTHLTGKIKHPMDPKRWLFVKYDPNIIIQAVYREFLMKDFIVQNGCISSRYLNMLQQITLQNYSHVKSERLFGFKQPKVVRLSEVGSAGLNSLFSVEHFKALHVLKCIDHPQFVQAGPTAEFIEVMNRWFNVQTGLCGTDWQKSVAWLNSIPRYIGEIEKCCREKDVDFLSAYLLSAFKFSTLAMILFLTEVNQT